MDPDDQDIAEMEGQPAYPRSTEAILAELDQLRRGVVPVGLAHSSELDRHAYLRERRRQVEAMAREIAPEEADDEIFDPDGEDEIPTYHGEIMPTVAAAPSYLTHKLYLARFISDWQINVVQRAFGGQPYAVLRIEPTRSSPRQEVTVTAPPIKSPCILMDDRQRGQLFIIGVQNQEIIWPWTIDPSVVTIQGTVAGKCDICGSMVASFQCQFCGGMSSGIAEDLAHWLQVEKLNVQYHSKDVLKWEKK